MAALQRRAQAVAEAAAPRMAQANSSAPQEPEVETESSWQKPGICAIYWWLPICHYRPPAPIPWLPPWAPAPRPWHPPWHPHPQPHPQPRPAPWHPPPPTPAPWHPPPPTPAPWHPPPPTPAPWQPSRPTPSLAEPSNAPLLTFYIYRVESEERWPLTNKNAGNLPGILWYLHNEIVWHDGGRHGTYFSHPVTKITKYKVKTKATQPLVNLGMNFGVTNAFDSNKCSGPFKCDNFATYGGTVGCETWDKNNPNNFPHQQWDGINVYPGATWYSLPVEGYCKNGQTPTGAGDCTYTYELMGEISIDELEGIKDFADFVAKGGREYDPKIDGGVHLSFWNRMRDPRFCQWRVEQAKKLFSSKYPWQPKLPEPVCNFNKHKFYPGRNV